MQDIPVYDAHGDSITELSQWDSNITLYISGEQITSNYDVHFYHSNSDIALVTPSSYSNGILSVIIPNILLQQSYVLFGCVVVENDGEKKSLYGFKIPIRKRPAPSSYVFVDTSNYVEVSQVLAECKEYADQSSAFADSAAESELNAEQYMKAAKSHSESASNYADNANVSANNATLSEEAAVAHADEARQYSENSKESAERAYQSEVGAGQYSDKAKQYADDAEQSAINSKSYSDGAAESLAKAEASTEQAKQYAESALESSNSAINANENAQIALGSVEQCVTAVSELEQSAEKYADIAKQYSGNPAMPINDTWWIWDADEQEYVDSGQRALLNYNGTYPSVEAMQADVDNQPINTIVIISSGVDEEDNAKLYIRDASGWRFLADLSGFTGVGIQTWVKTTGDGSPGTDDEYTITWTDGRKFKYTVHNGDVGPVGPQGKNFTIIDHYESLEELKELVDNPGTGDAYSVGEIVPYDIYIYGKTAGWVNNGPIQGPKGDNGETGKDATINGENAINIDSGDNVSIKMNDGTMTIGTRIVDDVTGIAYCFGIENGVLYLKELT